MVYHVLPKYRGSDRALALLPVYTADGQRLEKVLWGFFPLHEENLILSTVQLQYVTFKDKKPQSLFQWAMNVRDARSRLPLPSSLLTSVITATSLLFTWETFAMLVEGEDVVLPLLFYFWKGLKVEWDRLKMPKLRFLQSLASHVLKVLYGTILRGFNFLSS